MQKHQKLTDSLAKKALFDVANPKENYIWCSEPRGFALRLYKGGKKSFVFYYRVSGSKSQRFITIGEFPSFSVKAAREKAYEFKRMVSNGVDPQTEKRSRKDALSFQEFFEKHYLPQKERDRKDVEKDKRRIQLYVPNSFQKNKMDAITTQQLQRLKATLGDTSKKLQKPRKKALSNGTINRCLSLVKHVFSVAETMGYIKENPAKKLKLHPEKAGRDISLTTEQCQKLWQACEAEQNVYYSALFKLLFLTGRRVGELLGLKWSDVALDRGCVFFPDTKAGEAQLTYLSAPAIQVLKGLPRAYDNPYVFAGGVEGKPIQAYFKAWKRVLESAGLEHFCVHGLRHNAATMLLTQGMPMEAIGKFLGHKSSITTRRYAHFNPELTKPVADKLAEGLFGETDKKSEH